MTGAAGPILGKAGAERPAGERGHALAARAAAPDVVAVPVVPDVVLEPLVLDAALHAHVLEHAARPRHQPLIRQGRQLPVEGVLALGRGDHGAGDAGESRGLAGVDLDDGAAGLLQGAPDAGLQAELEHRVEQQAAADPRPHPGRDLTGARPPPERRELLPLDEVRRDDPVAPEPVIASGGDGLVDQRVERDRMVADRVPQQRAQGQRVRTALHEAGPVRGVLHAVGEDERLLLARVKGLVAEHAWTA